MPRPLFLLLLIAVSTTEAFSQRVKHTSPLERGQYDGPNKVGIWEYYDRPAKMSLRVDYDNGRLLYVEKDTSDFYVLEDDRLTRKKLEIPCRPHGTEVDILEHYGKNFKWPEQLVLRKKETARAALAFDVFPDGIARNPIVLENPGYNIDKVLLEAFRTAPPWWIVGIQKNDSAAICRFIVVYSLCREKCPEVSDLASQGKLLYHYRDRISQGARIGASFILNNESIGMQFSPDNKRLLIDAPGFKLDTLSAEKSPIVIDIASQQVQRISYAPTNGAWWITNQEVLIRYQYRSLPLLLARSRPGGATRTVSDSTCYAIQVSKDYSRLLFATLGAESRSIKLYVHDLKSGKSELLLPPLFVETMPIAWSDDGRFVILRERSDDAGQRYLLVNVQTREQIPIPLLQGQPIGWSADGSTLYLAKIKLGDYQFHGSLYAFNIQSGELTVINDKIKGLLLASYNAAKNQFLLRIKESLYTLRIEPEAKPEKLIEECRFAIWRPDGEGIAYVDRADGNAWYYSFAENKSTQLTNRPTTK
jgi:hypothetical protein